MDSEEANFKVALLLVARGPEKPPPRLGPREELKRPDPVPDPRGGRGKFDVDVAAGAGEAVSVDM